MDIDHLVPLAWAWERGAYGWSDAQRKRFANDPANLIPVLASENRAKGARGPLDWLPPNAAYHCDYVERFNQVVTRYGLSLSGPEQTAMDRLEQRKCSV